MRMLLQILLLAALTAFLALQIPRKALLPRARRPHAVKPPFASYVELGAEEYANRVKLSRMAWQVRARAAGRLDLEDGTPLADEMPAPPSSYFGRPPAPPPPSVKAEARPPASLAPPSVAAPETSQLPPLEDRRRDDMLDISTFESLTEKEIQQ